MGVECYLLRLHGRQSDFEAAVDYSQSALGALRDPGSHFLDHVYSYFVFSDTSHVIESEFSPQPDCFEISLRFALCHPDSVRQVFLCLAQSLMRQFNMTATICEDLPEGEPREYGPSDQRFADNCLWSMKSAQEEWRRDFGPEELGVSTSEALRHFFFEPRPVSKATVASTLQTEAR